MSDKLSNSTKDKLKNIAVLWAGSMLAQTSDPMEDVGLSEKEMAYLVKRVQDLGLGLLESRGIKNYVTSLTEAIKLVNP